jgi:hypothetical protein
VEIGQILKIELTGISLEKCGAVNISPALEFITVSGT